ncbi:acylphosphatase [Halomonas alkalicola]|uniref:acylphosphatase n=1 Tax=Halomonas alkalicola TaxID=1930622 RepID=UPI0026600D3F|nr:acylphosphatase [Halomonas alkalicola]
MNYFTSKAFEARGVSLCAYLIALAGFQRGLRVTFYNDPQLTSQVTTASDARGTIFSLSDDKSVHFFLRTRGSLTTSEAHRNSISKWKTKELLTRAGVGTPRGIMLETEEARQDPDLFARFGCREVVVKPVSGSLGKGVTTGITSQDQLVEALQTIESRRVVLEEHVRGVEYRYYVARGEVVAVTGREAANVVGDGESTLEALVASKNRVRARNPHLSSRRIKLDRATLSFLALQGQDLSTVPARGEKVCLSSAANLSRGGDSIDATQLVSDQSKAAAVAAASALGIPNAGVDIINVEQDGKEHNYVIELNSQAHIGSHSFPMQGSGQGNRVAEAIVESYFPERTSKIAGDVFFDFSYVKQALGTGGLSGVSLPVLRKGMLKKRLKLSSPLPADYVTRHCEKLMKQTGCFGEVHSFASGRFHIRLLAEERNAASFREELIKKLKEIEVIEEREFNAPIDAKVCVVHHLEEEVTEPVSSRLIIAGKVQGVGYRKWLQSRALKKAADGWVRNRSDGTVEALLHGNASQVAELVEECREGPARSWVDRVRVKESRLRPRAGFRVRSTLKLS